MANPVRITFLGGLGEIGRNCAMLECGGRAVVLDCGQKFAGHNLPGVNTILPNLDYLRENSHKLEAIIATHAHEDHIGAIAYLLEHISLPVYGSAFTLGIVEHKLSQAESVKDYDLRLVQDGDRFEIGGFDCEFLPVTHSIPSGNITAFHTEQGVILHSSDFKLDLDPVDGRRTNLSRIGGLADNFGIRLMLADSTNADIPGASRSETEIGSVIAELMRANASRRIIVACFASHIHRLQQVADAAVETGRIVVPIGMSMKRNFDLARNQGILKIPDYAVCDVDNINYLDDARVCVVCTGSQGEPRAALTQMSRDSNKWLKINSNDTVIISADPIPGNEAECGFVRNGLARLGANVVHSRQLDIHTSGHGKQQELKTLHSVAAPEFFVPVHGEYSHLVAHRDLALSMGMSRESVLLAQDGDQIELGDDGIFHLGSIGDGRIYVDGSAGNLGDVVLSERRALGKKGLLIVRVKVSMEKRKLLERPEVLSRGWVEQPALEKFEYEIEKRVGKTIRSALLRRRSNIEFLMKEARKEIGGLAFDLSKRRPMVFVFVSDC